MVNFILVKRQHVNTLKFAFNALKCLSINVFTM